MPGVEIRVTSMGGLYDTATLHALFHSTFQFQQQEIISACRILAKVNLAKAAQHVSITISHAQSQAKHGIYYNLNDNYKTPRPGIEPGSSA